MQMVNISYFGYTIHLKKRKKKEKNVSIDSRFTCFTSYKWRYNKQSLLPYPNGGRSLNTKYECLECVYHKSVDIKNV